MDKYPFNLATAKHPVTVAITAVAAWEGRLEQEGGREAGTRG